MATFKFNHKTVFYQCDGNKDDAALLILNGIMMSTKSWDAFVPSFTKNYYLIRVDLLDQGQTDKMTKEYTQALQVDLIKALLSELKLDQVHLMGISYGGSVALQFASRYPAKVNKLLLFNAVAKTSPWLKAIGDGWNEVAKSRNGLAYYHIAIPFIYSPGFYTKNVQWMEDRKALLVPLFSDASFLDAMIRLTKSAETHDVVDDLKHITMPTMVVASEHDYLTPVFEQEFLVSKLKNGQLITFNDCGHASMYEKPELFIATICGFLEDQETVKI